MNNFNDLALLVIEKRVGLKKRRMILSTFDANEVAGMHMYLIASLFDRKEGDIFLVLPNGEEFLVSNKRGSRDLVFKFPKIDNKRFDAYREFTNRGYCFSEKGDN